MQILNRPPSTPSLTCHERQTKLLLAPLINGSIKLLHPFPSLKRLAIDPDPIDVRHNSHVHVHSGRLPQTVRVDVVMNLIPMHIAVRHVLGATAELGYLLMSDAKELLLVLRAQPLRCRHFHRDDSNPVLPDTLRREPAVYLLHTGIEPFLRPSGAVVPRIPHHRIEMRPRFVYPPVRILHVLPVVPLHVPNHGGRFPSPAFTFHKAHTCQKYHLLPMVVF